MFGLSVSKKSRVIVRNSRICDTRQKAVPTWGMEGSKAITVGDALDWSGYSSVDIDGLTLCASDRASMVIDGQVAPGSRLAHIGLTDGDEQKGIVQQRWPPGGATPDIGPGAPAIAHTSGEPYPLPW
jgi:hypothetical protein